MMPGVQDPASHLLGFASQQWGVFLPYGDHCDRQSALSAGEHCTLRQKDCGIALSAQIQAADT